MKPKKSAETGANFFLVGGARRDRTDDLYNAIVALSQLSYGPITRCNGETLHRAAGYTTPTNMVQA